MEHVHGARVRPVHHRDDHDEALAADYEALRGQVLEQLGAHSGREAAVVRPVLVEVHPVVEAQREEVAVAGHPYRDYPRPDLGAGLQVPVPELGLRAPRLEVLGRQQVSRQGLVFLKHHHLRNGADDLLQF